MDFPILIHWVSPFVILGVPWVFLFIFYFILFFFFFFIFVLFVIENPVSKQWRPWSDAALCGVWSGSALFAYVPQKGRQAYLG